MTGLTLDQAGLPTRLQGDPRMTPVLKRIHHVEFAVGNAKQAAFFYLSLIHISEPTRPY